MEFRELLNYPIAIYIHTYIHIDGYCEGKDRKRKYFLPISS
jgi:hypothetical protein